MADKLRASSKVALLNGDRYLALLGIVLLGYAVMGKGFAYLGVPPLFVGEIAFLSGILVFLRTRALVAALATLPAVLLVALMALVLARTLPYFGLYGFDSLRDSTVVAYGVLPLSSLVCCLRIRAESTAFFATTVSCWRASPPFS